ncbi:MAG: hypothetical protein HY896_01265 [Deltaproteobacteria bacterium]|nr:hypothetical protein [Deltaproteobacteria bacterium]
MPRPRMNCPACGLEFESHPWKSAGGKAVCPYEGLEYPRLRVGHDRIYFGRWRKIDADPLDIVRAYRQIGDHLKEIGRVLEGMDLPVARRDHSKAVEAYRMGDPREDSQEALRFMDNALSYAHRVIDDLLHEKGLPPHHPMDFAAWYDTAEVPFGEEW